MKMVVKEEIENRRGEYGKCNPRTKKMILEDVIQ
jgi:hypothetical protein